MLAVYLFNLAGYNFIFTYCIDKSDKRIEQLADHNSFATNDLVELKFKLNLPYLTDWSGYERFDGQVEFNGEHYNYIERKVSQEPLTHLCLPNEGKTNLSKGKIDYAAKENDTPAGNEKNNNAASKNFSLGECFVKHLEFNFSDNELSTSPEFPSFIVEMNNPYLESPGQPPETTLS